MKDELIILPSIRALRGDSGNFILPRKYMEGVNVLADYWPGRVTSLVEMTDVKSSDFDHIEVNPKGSRSSIEMRSASLKEIMQRTARASAVLGFLGRRDAKLAPLCKAVGLPLVFVTEYTPRTEAQIIDLGTHNPISRLRRRLWLSRTEFIRRRAISQAAGLQCSGAAVYEHYQKFHENCLLFFDNRVRRYEVLENDACREKFNAMKSGRPLRLVYGGRLVSMKGVLHLPKFASALRQAGVEFHLDIFGDGPLRDELLASIKSLDLGNLISVRAPVDFRTEWIEILKKEKDLFVCCHPQGDPSSTYPEVMSCGVPIVGYANEAFRGIVAHASVGWKVPVDQPRALAQKVRELDANRDEIIVAAQHGLQFARENSFESTFRKRAQHLISLSR